MVEACCCCCWAPPPRWRPVARTVAAAPLPPLLSEQPGALSQWPLPPSRKKADQGPQSQASSSIAGFFVAVGELPARGRGGVEVPFFCFSFLFEKRESRAMRLGFLSFFWVETGDWRDEEMNEEVVARSCGSSRGAEPSWFCAERNTRGFCSGVCSGVCSLEKPWRERTKKKTVSCLFRALYFLNFHSLAQAALLVLLKSSRRGGRRRSWK